MLLLFHPPVSSVMCLLCITVEMDAEFAAIQVPGRLKERLSQTLAHYLCMTMPTRCITTMYFV